MKKAIFLIILFVAYFSSIAQNENIDKHPKSYICYLANDKIEIDGDINDSCWLKTEWTDLFQDIEGEKMSKPEFKTKAKMLWDDKYLYFAVEIEEPHIWATITKRESVIFYDNDFEIFIDPNGDNHNYYEYEINAFGTEWEFGSKLNFYFTNKRFLSPKVGIKNFYSSGRKGLELGLMYGFYL